MVRQIFADIYVLLFAFRHTIAYIYLGLMILTAMSFGWGAGVWSERTGVTTNDADEHFSFTKTLSFFIFVLIVVVGFIGIQHWAFGK